MRDMMYNFENCDIDIVKAVDNYMPELRNANCQYISEIIDDIYASKEKYRLRRYDEYFKYDFINLPDEKRKSFIGGEEYFDYVKSSFDGNYDDCMIFKNKIDTYNIYKDYYHRDVVGIKNFNDYINFENFAKKNKTFIVKDEMGSLGIDVKKITLTNSKEIKPAFFSLLQYGGCICEEWINQCDEFAEFCDTCVNTIRFISAFDNGELTRIYALFRTGRKGSIVDNTSMGGIASAVDVESGIVISDGYSKTNLEYFEKHPDSGKKYKGFQIPRWDELIDLVKQLHCLYKKSRFVGWDLTLTKNGWILVEGNGKPNFDTIQIINYKTFGHGLRDELINALGKYKNQQ